MSLMAEGQVYSLGKQTVLVEVADENVNPAAIAEVVTRAGYDVLTVECDGGKIWTKPEKK